MAFKTKQKRTNKQAKKKKKNRSNEESQEKLTTKSASKVFSNQMPKLKCCPSLKSTIWGFLLDKIPDIRHATRRCKLSQKPRTESSYIIIPDRQT